MVIKLENWELVNTRERQETNYSQIKHTPCGWTSDSFYSLDKTPTAKQLRTMCNTMQAHQRECKGKASENQ